MKKSFMDESKELFKLGRRYLGLQLDCLKLTASEKATLLIASLTMGLIGILMCALCVVLLAMSAVSLFGEIMNPALAYLCVAGCVAVLTFVVFLLRKYIIINPIARLITKLVCPKTPKSANHSAEAGTRPDTTPEKYGE